jgi:hypothetical protein
MQNASHIRKHISIRPETSGGGIENGRKLYAIFDWKYLSSSMWKMYSSFFYSLQVYMQNASHIRKHKYQLDLKILG